MGEKGSVARTSLGKPHVLLDCLPSHPGFLGNRSLKPRIRMKRTSSKQPNRKWPQLEREKEGLFPIYSYRPPPMMWVHWDSKAPYLCNNRESEIGVCPRPRGRAGEMAPTVLGFCLGREAAATSCQNSRDITTVFTAQPNPNLTSPAYPPSIPFCLYFAITGHISCHL